LRFPSCYHVHPDPLFSEVFHAQRWNMHCSIIDLGPWNSHLPWNDWCTPAILLGSNWGVIRDLIYSIHLIAHRCPHSHPFRSSFIDNDHHGPFWIRFSRQTSCNMHSYETSSTSTIYYPSRWGLLDGDHVTWTLVGFYWKQQVDDSHLLRDVPEMSSS